MQYSKQDNLNENAQNILFDDEGFIIESDEQIFDTSSIREASLVRYFPFIDSILNTLQQLSPDEPAINFAKVETTYQGLRGIYDYYFSKKIIDGNLVTHWQVIDKTKDYIVERDKQQDRQDNIISGHKSI